MKYAISVLGIIAIIASTVLAFINGGGWLGGGCGDRAITRPAALDVTAAVTVTL